MLGMNSDQRITSITAAVLYASAALVSCVSLWFVVPAALALKELGRPDLVAEIQPALFVWALVVVSGAVLSVLSLKFERLSNVVRYLTLLGSCVVALISGIVLGWWQSFYFFFPPLALVFVFRKEFKNA
jgi:hypothetical protein